METVNRFIGKTAIQQVLPVVRFQGQFIQQGAINLISGLNVRQLCLWDWRWWRTAPLPAPLSPAALIGILTIQSGFQMLVDLVPRYVLIVGINVEYASGEAAAFGAAEHILFQVDVSSSRSPMKGRLSCDSMAWMRSAVSCSAQAEMGR